MFDKVLVVCIGNICRSPTAEYLLRERLRGRATTVASAGLAAVAGNPIDPMAGALLAERGIDASGHRARQVDEAAILTADLVLVMQRPHLASLARYSSHAVGRTFLLGKWQDGAELVDPFGQPRDAFEDVYRTVELAAERWCELI